MIEVNVINKINFICELVTYSKRLRTLIYQNSILKTVVFIILKVNGMDCILHALHYTVETGDRLSVRICHSVIVTSYTGWRYL